jgi:hypothetical protein
LAEVKAWKVEVLLLKGFCGERLEIREGLEDGLVLV